MSTLKFIRNFVIVFSSMIIIFSYSIMPSCKKAPPEAKVIHDTIRIIKPDTIKITCDTNVYTYSGAVYYIMQANCATTGCHTTIAAPSSLGYDLSNYAGVDSAVHKGRIMGCINQQTGYFAMPKSGGKLSNCEITVIQKWINTGALNN